jgi:4-amino-4-deoxy-L-arabinose transferase-like glycosyltransferase
MTSTRQTGEPPSGEAAAAAWRRQRRHWDVLSAADRGGRAAGRAGSEHMAGAQPSSQLPEAQVAGLSAILRLAKTERAGTTSHGAPAAISAGASASAHPGAAAGQADLTRPLERPAPADEKKADEARPHCPAPAAAEQRETRSIPALTYLPGLPLLVILTVQASLSLRLVRSNTAFTDEALYLWAGHLEWAHWLHGAAIPDLPSYFSGAPVLYPPIGALADSLAGLAGARTLSLCFMLAATALLYATTARLFGRPAGFVAAALWAVTGPTLKLGAFATFDPMSTFLMALAIWCVVRSADQRERAAWIIAGAAALSVANATTYSSAIFDPVIIAIALLAPWPQIGARAAAMRAALLGAYVVALMIAFITVAGSGYSTGLGATVLDRADGTSSASVVLHQALSWTWPVAALSVAATAVALIAERSRSRRVLMVVLVLSMALVPFEQARVHTTTSLDKHVDFGMWLAAITIGYGVGKAWQLRLRIPRAVLVGTCAALAVPLAPAGLAQAQAMFGWPNSAEFVAALRPLAEHASGPLLVEAPSPARYYLGTSVSWQRWSTTWAVTLANGDSVGQTAVSASGRPQVYAGLIARGYFTLVALNSTATPVLDQQIVADMIASHRYRLVKTVAYPATYYGSYYSIWQRT